MSKSKKRTASAHPPTDVELTDHLKRILTSASRLHRAIGLLPIETEPWIYEASPDASLLVGAMQSHQQLVGLLHKGPPRRYDAEHDRQLMEAKRGGESMKNGALTRGLYDPSQHLGRAEHCPLTVVEMERSFGFTVTDGATRSALIAIMLVSHRIAVHYGWDGWLYGVQGQNPLQYLPGSRPPSLPAISKRSLRAMKEADPQGHRELIAHLELLREISGRFTELPHIPRSYLEAIERAVALLETALPRATLEANSLPRHPHDPNALRHSPDYRSVAWGKSWQFSLTSGQAKVVTELHKALKDGTPEVGYRRLLSDSGSAQTNRLQDVFKKNGFMSEAWGTLIVPGSTKGTYRLNPEITS